MNHHRDHKSWELLLLRRRNICRIVFLVRDVGFAFLKTERLKNERTNERTRQVRQTESAATDSAESQIHFLSAC